jgi:hypothetical protein
MAISYTEVVYKFDPSGKTVPEVIREHNHKNINEFVLGLLIEEFKKINSFPLKMGEEASIPVLNEFIKNKE